MAIQKIGVLGCGLMGSGIAEVAAKAGFQVVVREVTQ
ncbi:MAG: 3-hydroxybutyryl-CoA dehydrogenase, partial [Acidobacteria bacterium]|nr:3-hydroxybutyryl-CoA dehydrogenase [Acidobacteriota bacterium]